MVGDKHRDGLMRRWSWPWATETGALVLVLALLGGARAAAAKKPTTQRCEQLLDSRHAVSVPGTTPASVLASYAVLRRPEGPADRSSTAQGRDAGARQRPIQL